MVPNDLGAPIVAWTTWLVSRSDASGTVYGGASMSSTHIGGPYTSGTKVHVLGRH